jgi:hypothetical protein
MPQSEKETEDFLAIQAALRRSNLRLDAARKFKTKKKSY